MKTFLTILLLSWLTGSAQVQIAVAQNEDVAVVVNPKNPISNVTMAELHKIFAGQKRTWAGGMPIKLVVRGPGSNERLVLLRMLGMEESEYKQYWIAQVFHGETQSEPVTLFSNGMQKEAINAFPGAIALVTPKDVKPGMKVIKVDGLLPGVAGYPLH